LKDSFYEEVEGSSDQFPKKHMKNLLHLSEKLKRGDNFKPTTGNESLHETSNDNGITVIHFATSLVVTIKILSHRKIHKYAWTSPDGKIHNQVDQVLVDRRPQSSFLDVQSGREADCDTDRHLVAARRRERLSVIKRATQKFDMQKFYLKKLNDAEVKEHYQTGWQLWKTWMLV
jgi:hypothetical protein